MESMSLLAKIACLVGSVVILAAVPALAWPARVRQALKAFPRSRWPAWILTAVDLMWVAWIVLHASLGRFEFLKPSVYIVGPLSFVLIVFFMDDLLAPRALGGLLMLIADPVVDAARWHPSPWRLVLTVLAYFWVIAGIVLVLSPYRFRQVGELVAKTDARFRLTAVVRLVVGAGILFLGLRVY